jgi:hypothetical protein
MSRLATGRQLPGQRPEKLVLECAIESYGDGTEKVKRAGGIDRRACGRTGLRRKVLALADEITVSARLH